MNVVIAIFIAMAIAYLIGYITSWVIHGKLIKRIMNTRFYMKKGRYSLATAWKYAGVTL